MTMIQEVNL